MVLAHKLFTEGKYEESLALLRKEATRDRHDDLNIGAVCEVGGVLICLQRYGEAVEHFKHLISSTNYRVSVHRTYLGLAYWFGRKKKQAVETWLEASERAQYRRYYGLDVPFILYFAASMQPKYYSCEDALAKMRPQYERHKVADDFETHTAAYLLDIIDQQEYSTKVLTITEGRRIRQRIALHRALLHYYLACKAASRRRMSECRRLMSVCAEIGGHDELFMEMVIAKCIASA